MDSLALYRAGRWCLNHRIPVLPRVFKGLGLVLFGAVVPPEAQIGPETMLGYGGSGVVIHYRSTIGSNVMISPGVVIGGRSGSEGVPRIGDDVFVGAGAKILGDLVVGDGAVIGANAVVLHDVPARAVVAGIPATVVKSDVDVRAYCRLPRDVRQDKRG